MNTLSKLQRDYDAMTPPEDYPYTLAEEAQIEETMEGFDCDRATAISILKGEFDEYE